MMLCRVGNPEKGLGISRLPLELAWPLLNKHEACTKLRDVREGHL